MKHSELPKLAVANDSIDHLVGICIEFLNGHEFSKALFPAFYKVIPLRLDRYKIRLLKIVLLRGDRLAKM